jgi:ubiquinone/menaquinone biosynthesis C-methylase UbiE
VDLRDRIRDWWDDDALAYDTAPGHSLSDPVEAAVWRAALAALLPPAPSRVLDVGAGTGSMSLLAAELGHEVTALDLSGSMLDRAKEKAVARSLAIDFVVGPAEEPPSGPFDAVMARHVLWTLPEPAEALAAWRRSTQAGGSLVLFEGSWGGDGPLAGARDAIAASIDRIRGTGGDHHAPYPAEVIDRLPLRDAMSPAPFVAAVREAGWTRIRLVRLRDVEWAAASRAPWPLGWLRRRPRYAIVADAGPGSSKR